MSRKAYLINGRLVLPADEVDEIGRAMFDIAGIEPRWTIVESEESDPRPLEEPK